MTTYYLTNINETQQPANLAHLKNRGVNNIADIEKICAAECYVEITKMWIRSSKSKTSWNRQTSIRKRSYPIT